MTRRSSAPAAASPTAGSLTASSTGSVGLALRRSAAPGPAPLDEGELRPLEAGLRDPVDPVVPVAAVAPAPPRLARLVADPAGDSPAASVTALPRAGAAAGFRADTRAPAACLSALWPELWVSFLAAVGLTVRPPEARPARPVSGVAAPEALVAALAAPPRFEAEGLPDGGDAAVGLADEPRAGLLASSSARRTDVFADVERPLEPSSALGLAGRELFDRLPESLSRERSETPSGAESLAPRGSSSIKFWFTSCSSAGRPLRRDRTAPRGPRRQPLTSEGRGPHAARLQIQPATGP